MEELISTGQAAKIIGVYASTVRYWCEENRLSHLKLPTGQYRVRRSDLEQFIKDNWVPAEAKVAVGQPTTAQEYLATVEVRESEAKAKGNAQISAGLKAYWAKRKAEKEAQQNGQQAT